MPIRDDIKKELTALISEADSIMAKLGKSKPDGILLVGTEYQTWFTKALSLVKVLAPDRIAEFREYYDFDPKRKGLTILNYSLRDYLSGLSAPLNIFNQPEFDARNLAWLKLANQGQLLASLASRCDSVLDDVEARLLAGLADAELRAAALLSRTNLRAGGVIAGVILEAHLGRVAANHQVSLAKKDPSISELNEALKAAGLYDLPRYRKIQHLADIRNVCCHKKPREPEESEVADLIGGVDEILKTLF